MVFFLFVIGALLAGMASIAFAATGVSSGLFSSRVLAPFAIGLAWILPVGLALHLRAGTTVFDKRIGYCWTGRTDEGRDGNAPKNAVELREIYALQIIFRAAPGGPGKGFRLTRELNLVLKSGNRLGVLVEADHGRIRKWASILAELLGTPVWDATG
jgi:hypothetical protein